MSSTASDKLALKSAIESFIVFFISGMLSIIIGSYFINLFNDLPDGFLTLIQEPISTTFFFLLSLISLTLIALQTRCGKTELDDSGYSAKAGLAIARAAISCGAIASGMILGIGSGLLSISWLIIGSELYYTALKFITLGLYYLAVLFPVSFLMFYLINRDRQHNTIIMASGWLYIAGVTLLSFVTKGKNMIIGMLMCLALLLTLALVFRHAPTAGKEK